jgi:hypothetical protein
MAWFKHACIVSYRHGQHAIIERFIRELMTGLSAELEMLRDEKVFVDYDRLKSGQIIDANLARAVYQSACMVSVYQPNYFDRAHTYCAREYRAMCGLEDKRLQLLPPGAERTQGLIIPVVLRGRATVPEELGRRAYEDFSKFMLMDKELLKHREFATQIRKIAEYIDARCKVLEQIEVPPNDEHFVLPSDESVRGWLDTVIPPRMKFPGSEA